MANEEHLAKLREGVEAWNAWMQADPHMKPDLRGATLQRIELVGANLNGADLIEAEFQDANLTGARLTGAELMRSNFWRAKLCDANLFHANLRGAFCVSADFRGANFHGAELQEIDFYCANLREIGAVRVNLAEANLRMADLRNADLRESNFSRANLADANLTSANISGAQLSGTSLLGTDLSGTTLDSCRVYGVSAWDVIVDEQTSQRDLVITPKEQDAVTVDDLKVAQFIYLLLTNPEIRGVIDTITSKVVLILGRFTEDRKKVLDGLRDELRKRNYTPVMFDFEKPDSRDLTETISTLAHMARFVIADITDAKSIPQELMKIVPNLPSLPVKPIILDGQYEYAMFKDFGGYLSVLPPWRYQDSDHLLASLETEVIGPALSKAEEIEERRRAFEEELVNR